MGTSNPYFTEQLIDLRKFVAFDGPDQNALYVNNSNNKDVKWWFPFLSPLLFWMPDVYLANLRQIWIKGPKEGSSATVNIELWNEFIRTLRNDWENSTTPVSRGLVSPRDVIDTLMTNAQSRPPFCYLRMLDSSQFRVSIPPEEWNLRHRSLRTYRWSWVWPHILLFKYWLVDIGLWLGGSAIIMILKWTYVRFFWLYYLVLNGLTMVDN